MQELGHKYPDRGYGENFFFWLIDRDPKPYNSWGNGSGMRVSPVGFYAHTLDEALDLAKVSAEVTHNHPEGIKGAQAVAAAIFLLTSSLRHPKCPNGQKEALMTVGQGSASLSC